MRVLGRLSIFLSLSIILICGCKSQSQGPVQLTTVNAPQGGRIRYGVVTGATTQGAALTRLLSTIHTDCGEKPQIGKPFQFQGSNSIGVFFTVTDHPDGNVPLAGLVIANATGPNQIDGAMLFDEASRFGTTVNPLLQQLPSLWSQLAAQAPSGAMAGGKAAPAGAGPAVAGMKKYALPDGTASVSMPANWTVNSQSGGGTMMLNGPHGEMAVLDNMFLATDPRSLKNGMKPLKGQIDDLINESRKRAEAKERVLVTTLTKRTAEELTDYLRDIGVNVRYLHSEIDAIERVEILRALRKGEFDVLVGINLLREGLDLPEVSLVAILDADKEGFLRSETSLIQTAGRAARHLNGEVILYADVMTESIKKFLAITQKRRARQLEYNRQHDITPRSVSRAVEESLAVYDTNRKTAAGVLNDAKLDVDLTQTISELETEMLKAAEDLQFEKAALLRDQIKELKRMLDGKPEESPKPVSYRKSAAKRRR